MKGLAKASHSEALIPGWPALMFFGTWCRSHFQGQCGSYNFQGHVFKPQKSAPNLQTRLEIAEQTHPGAPFQPLTSPILEA